MKRLLVVVAFAFLIAPVVASANQEIGREFVEFKIIFTVPESGVHGTQVECQYSNSRNLWIRSSAGNEELLSIRSGESVGDECRFSGSVTLDVHSEQTFTFDYRKLFTTTPEEMSGNNIVEIEYDPGLGYQGHGLRKQGKVAAVAPTPTSDPETAFQLVARIEGVESAQEAWFVNSSNDILPTEASDLIVITYTFDSDDNASESFPPICDHIANQISNLHHGTSQKEISVGLLGDEACAYIDGKSGDDLWIAARVGRHILTVSASKKDGDTVNFTADWLDEYLKSLPDDAESIMPSLADMPRGWTPFLYLEDITDETVP